METDLSKCPCCYGPSKEVGPGYYGTIYCCQDKDCKGTFFTVESWQRLQIKYHTVPDKKKRKPTYIGKN